MLSYLSSSAISGIIFSGLLGEQDTYQLGLIAILNPPLFKFLVLIELIKFFLKLSKLISSNKEIFINSEADNVCWLSL